MRKYQHYSALLMAAFVGSALFQLSLQPQQAGAESLFRAAATHSESRDFTPRPLFFQPVSKNVGDIITILVDENIKQQITSQMQINRKQEINENGTSLFNNAFRFLAGKVPFVSGDKLKDVAPSFDGMDNENKLTSQVQSNKNIKFTESIACQVVEVLPNGYLLVQGHKNTTMSKERMDLVVSGIINPFYLDKQNRVSSKLVGNFQFANSGKGVISRSQTDSVANKIYQFFN